MTTSKPRPALADVLAAWAWVAVALTPVGWFYGFLSIAYSHLGDVTDVSMMTEGVVLFAAAPTSAFILAACAARAGHRSGKVAVIVSGLLLLATLVVLTLAFWWVGLPAAAVVAVLVLVWVRSRDKPPPGPDGAQREGGADGPDVPQRGRDARRAGALHDRGRAAGR